MQEYTDCCLAFIKLRFGELGYRVAKALSFRPRQNMDNLVKATKLDIEVVCEGLAALIQHDIAVCQYPVVVENPKYSAKTPASKRTVQSRKRSRNGEEENSEDDYDQGDGQNDIKIVTDLDKREVNTHFFGTDGAGYIRSTDKRATKKFGVIHTIVANKVVVTKGNQNDKMEYSLDLDMIRGLMRQADYFFVLKRLRASTHVLFLLEEFCVRGKLSIEQALLYCTARMESDEHHSKLEAQWAAEAEALERGEDAPISESKDDNVSSADALNMVGVAVKAVDQAMSWLLEKKFITQSRGFVDTDVALLASSNTGSSSSGTSYIINHDRFTLYLRNDECIQYVARRVNSLSAMVVGTILFGLVHLNVEKTQDVRKVQELLPAFLDYSELHYKPAALLAPSSERNVTTLGEAWHYIRKNGLTNDHIRDLLHELSHGHIDIVQKRQNRVNFSYWVNVDKILQGIRLEHCRTFVKQSFLTDAERPELSDYATRVFGVLCDYMRLEEKQISDIALVPRVDVRGLLMRLQTLHLAEVQDIPKTADRLPTKSIFVWSLAHSRVRETMMAYLCRVTRNMAERLIVETGKAQSVLDKSNAGVELTNLESADIAQWVGKFEACETVLRKYTR